MRFKKLEQVNPINSFILEVTFMHGDADSYSTEEVDIGINAQTAIPYIEFFERCRALYARTGMGGSDGFWEVEGYQDFSYFIPTDITSEEGHADIESIKLYWYDSFGGKHEYEYIC